MSEPTSRHIEDDPPPFPGDEAEAAFLAGERESFETAVPVRNEPVDDRPLPPLDSLVARVPGETQAQLDELFRARFVRVRRLQPGELR